MGKWSEEAWDAAADIFERIKRHPFIQQLAAGTLSESRFRHYISQDRLYLEDYTRVLAHIASRLPEMMMCRRSCRLPLTGWQLRNLFMRCSPPT